jgi:hypothetical protein
MDFARRPALLVELSQKGGLQSPATSATEKRFDFIHWTPRIFREWG